MNSGFSGSDDVSSNNSHFNISHFGSGSSNNYRERDNFGGNNSSSNNQQSNNRTSDHGGDSAFNQGVRETGIIEKLLVNNKL